MKKSSNIEKLKTIVEKNEETKTKMDDLIKRSSLFITVNTIRLTEK